jgi:V/A-type H+/Na+-transporting ATPase subunit E
MGLQHVKEEIIEHAQNEAKEIIVQAKSEAKKTLDEAHGVAESFEEETKIHFDNEFAMLEQKYHARMKMQAKKISFQARKKVLADLFVDMRKKLVGLSKEKRTKILGTLYDRAKKQCSEGRIYCARQDVPIVKKYTKNVVVDDMFGGLILESKDKTIRIDYSFDSILAVVEEEKLQDVATILF